MRPLFLGLVLVLFVCKTHAAGASTQVIASVADITIGRPLEPRFVEVFMRIHSPSTLSGATLVLVTNTFDRSVIRSQMPKGTLYKIVLPESVILDLKKQRDEQESIDRGVDHGTLPEVNSRFVALTQVRIADLSVSMAPLLPKQ